MMFALQGWVYIITNADGADNYKVVRAPVDAPQQSNWVEVVPPSGSRKIEDMDMFKVRGYGLWIPLCCAPVSPHVFGEHSRNGAY
jgi:hypothetical protein